MGRGREARGEGSEEKNRLTLTSGTGISIVEILQCSSSPTTTILMPQEHTSTRGTQQGPLYLPWLVIWCAMAWAVTLFPTPASFAAERVTDTNTASSRIGQSHPTLVEAKRLIESQQAEAAIAPLDDRVLATHAGVGKHEVDPRSAAQANTKLIQRLLVAQGATREDHDRRLPASQELRQVMVSCPALLAVVPVVAHRLLR